MSWRGRFWAGVIAVVYSVLYVYNSLVGEECFTCCLKSCSTDIPIVC